MKTIELRAVSINGTYAFELIGKVRQTIVYFNAVFESGKVYGLIGELVFGAPAISWCVAGMIIPREGIILVDDKIATHHLLRKISHRVWVEPKELPFFERNVRTLIRKGLEESDIEQSFEEVIRVFGLERLDRPLRQCSGERWRASIAIGFLQGKSVFCFPWLWHDFVEKYKDAWMKHIFDFLRENHRLVLVPTNNDKIGNICDEVMYFRSQDR